MPYDLQVKLLRVLEDGQVRPLGAKESHGVDVRVAAAQPKRVRICLYAEGFQPERPLNLIAPDRIDPRFIGIVGPSAYSLAHRVEDRLSSSAFHRGGFCAGPEVFEDEVVALAVHGHLMTRCPFSRRLKTVGHVESR